MKNETPVVIRDNKNQKHILIQVNLNSGNTQVLSNFSAQDNLAIIMGALGATAQKCLTEGYSRANIIKTIHRYMEKVLDGYGIRGD